MNQIGDRISKLRKALGLSRKKFSEALGTTEDVIINIEYNRLKNPDQKEPLFKLICQLNWNGKMVNEDWLFNGTGGDENMFIPQDMTYLYNTGRMGNERNEFKKFYLNMMMELPDEYWDYIYNEFKKFESKKKEGS